MSNYVNPLSMIAAAPMTQQKNAKGGAFDHIGKLGT